MWSFGTITSKRTGVGGHGSENRGVLGSEVPIHRVYCSGYKLDLLRQSERASPLPLLVFPGAGVCATVGAARLRPSKTDGVGRPQIQNFTSLSLACDEQFYSSIYSLCPSFMGVKT